MACRRNIGIEDKDKISLIDWNKNRITQTVLNCIEYVYLSGSDQTRLGLHSINQLFLAFALNKVDALSHDIPLKESSKDSSGIEKNISLAAAHRTESVFLLSTSEA